MAGDFAWTGEMQFPGPARASDCRRADGQAGWMLHLLEWVLWFVGQLLQQDPNEGYVWPLHSLWQLSRISVTFRPISPGS